MLTAWASARKDAPPMSVTLIQDLRWGDTGKGKISEYMAHPDRCDVSIRAVGGGNAGHVIQRDTRKISLHLLPAGCLHEGVDTVLGQGMVTHPGTLLKEIMQVHEMFGSDPLSRLYIAKENHLLFDGHKLADKALEKRRGKDTIGTTSSGIGIAYADKALRVGMRMEELKNGRDTLKDRYRKLVTHWAATYGVQMSTEEQDADVASLLEARELLGGAVCDMTSFWQKKFSKNARVVIEGAQGSLLSIDSDGYPYVTSSATSTNGHMQGAGIPARELSEVIGTLKAYDTRVGNGPMLTEMEPERARMMIEKGGERGSTTGRERRPGYLNLQDTARRAWEESATKLAVLKADILDGDEDIPVMIGMQNDEPVYKCLAGWEKPIAGLTNYEELDPNAQDFYRFIGDYTGVPVAFMGTGPESSQLIVQ